MAETPLPLPAFTSWDTFPFEGDLKVKALDAPVDVEPARKGEEIADCKACQSRDDSYIWVNERWRVRSMDRPTGLPMILILEPRSHLDLGDLPNLLAAELGVMTVRVERAIRSLDDVARVHVNRWGDGAAHLHLWFMARPKGQLQLRGSFLPMWDDILPPVEERRWREDLALVAAWLAEFGGTALAQPPRIEWQAPSSFVEGLGVLSDEKESDGGAGASEASPAEPAVQVSEGVEKSPETEKPSGAAVGVASVPRPGQHAAATGQHTVAAGQSVAVAGQPGAVAGEPGTTAGQSTAAPQHPAQPPTGSVGQPPTGPVGQPPTGSAPQPPTGSAGQQPIGPEGQQPPGSAG